MNGQPLPSVTLEGKYAKLVPMAPEHVVPMFELMEEDRSTYSLTSAPKSLENTKKYVELALQDQQRGWALPFVTIDKSSGDVAGSSRFLDIHYWNIPDEKDKRYRPTGTPHVLEIGATWLGQRFQRTGINTDAKILMLTYAFEHWKVFRVCLKTDSRNQRSRNNIERIGAKFDGVVRAHRPAFDGEIRDTAYYSILLEEWPAVKEQLQKKLR